MDKHRRHIFAAFIIVLLIVAALTAWLTADFSGGEEAADPSTPVSAAPSPSDDPAESDPLPSASAAPVVTPTPTPSPSAVPQGKILSGSFDSNTGCTLNTHTEWAVTVSSTGKYIMEVKVYLRSYTVGIGPRTGCVSILGTDYRFSTGSISVEATNSPKNTLLYTTSHELPLKDGELLSVPISVSWNFAGVYSGNDIDSIDSQTTVVVQG